MSSDRLITIATCKPAVNEFEFYRTMQQPPVSESAVLEKRESTLPEGVVHVSIPTTETPSDTYVKFVELSAQYMVPVHERFRLFHAMVMRSSAAKSHLHLQQTTQLLALTILSMAVLFIFNLSLCV